MGNVARLNKCTAVVTVLPVHVCGAQRTGVRRRVDQNHALPGHLGIRRLERGGRHPIRGYWHLVREPPVGLGGQCTSLERSLSRVGHSALGNAGSCSSITATAEVINLNSATPSWRYVGSMATPRKQLNLTLLPDGRVLATGGSSGALGYDDLTSPVYTAEVWDPVTETWSTWASSAVYRGYHSTTLLLPDGRVLHAGGNKSGTETAVRQRTGIYPTVFAERLATDHHGRPRHDR